MTTFEGHAWERILFANVHQHDQNIICSGYTHAPIFRYQHAIKRSISKISNPDILFTAGKIQKHQLRNCDVISNYKNVKVLGTSKIYTKNYEPRLINYNQSNIKKDYNILVIPEGIESEIDILFKYSLDCALNYSKLNFIWRLHPLFLNHFSKNICIISKIFFCLITKLKMTMIHVVGFFIEVVQL